jgi:hypothetical protein
MLPLGCLPLWGREGVTLIPVAENKQELVKRGFQQSQKFLLTATRRTPATPYLHLPMPARGNLIPARGGWSVSPGSYPRLGNSARFR